MELEVFLGFDPIGVLTHDPEANRYKFDYAPAWLERAGRFPLSPFIPLEPAAASPPDERSRNVRQFFENLLPEGQTLDDAAAAAKISKTSLIGLLAVLGRETAGALRIFPKTGLAESVTGGRRLLAPAELSERIRARPDQPFAVWDGKVRLSIAGHQDKLAVYLRDKQWFLVDANDLASTHILKPEPISSALAGLTSNELFCMRLAAAVGVSAAPVELIHVPQPVLQIQRFDRQMSSASVARLHVIDGCQALGLSVDAKYERLYGSGRDVQHIRDGATLPKLFAALNESARPLLQRRALLRWAIFQILIRNPDAHAKNLSFYSNVQGLSLAPAYDLISVYALERDRVEDTYAMAIGDAFTPEELSPYEWALFASRCDLPKSLVSQQLTALCREVRRQSTAVAATVVAQGAEPRTIDRIVAATLQECERQEGIAAKVPHVTSD